MVSLVFQSFDRCPADDVRIPVLAILWVMGRMTYIDKDLLLRQQYGEIFEGFPEILQEPRRRSSIYCPVIKGQ